MTRYVVLKGKFGTVSNAWGEPKESAQEGHLKDGRGGMVVSRQGLCAQAL